MGSIISKALIQLAQSNEGSQHTLKLSWECWQHVEQHIGDVSKCCQFWVDMHVGANTKIILTQKKWLGGCRQIVDTVVRTDTVVHTPRGGNTVDKLNKSKLSGHVNVLRLVLPSIHWWCCCCCLFLWQWMMVSSNMVVAVAAVVAQRQQQRQRGWQWTTIGGKSGQQQER